MTNYHTYSTIVEGIVSCGIKEWNLQNTSGKADFVRGRVIVCIHRLWCHVPVVTIDRFSCHVVYLPCIPETAAFFHVFIIALRGVDGQF